uniref:Uncharacterized protein n=1 Tax=Cannabis sativa TaxID=3483 RepID=A0A803QNY5_CANSA
MTGLNKSFCITIVYGSNMIVERLGGKPVSASKIVNANAWLALCLADEMKSSAYFHANLKKRIEESMIASFINSSGQIVDEYPLVVDHFIYYFRTNFVHLTMEGLVVARGPTFMRKSGREIKRDEDRVARGGSIIERPVAIKEGPPISLVWEVVACGCQSRTSNRSTLVAGHRSLSGTRRSW